jgi:hypothetical protein
MSKSHAHLRETVKQLASKSSIKKSLSAVIEGPSRYLVLKSLKIQGGYYFVMSNARDTTYFTTKCLQTDVASKVEVAMSLKYNT